jgi:hypothetical protein
VLKSFRCSLSSLKELKKTSVNWTRKPARPGCQRDCSEGKKVIIGFCRMSFENNFQCEEGESELRAHPNRQRSNPFFLYFFSLPGYDRPQARAHPYLTPTSAAGTSFKWRVCLCMVAYAHSQTPFGGDPVMSSHAGRAPLLRQLDCDF